MSSPSPTLKDPSTQNPTHSTKGALLVSPLALCRLSDADCPICHEPYCDLPEPDQELLSDQEFAVSIDMVAEWHGSKKLCGHILGRKCFERHLQSKGAWRNRCPLCRDVWFSGDEGDDEELDDDTQEHEPSTPESTASTSRPRRSARIASRTPPGSNTSSPRMSVSSGVNRSRRRQASRPRHFTQQLLAALEVQADGEEVTGTMEDVERRLHALYRNMYS